jgi:hypothetical protein
LIDLANLTDLSESAELEGICRRSMMSAEPRMM